mmetsp:Transcript_10749/g.21778  ORF Transcript_10749/g.21778 Transcript_10749/m.21778 type:complete len:82 (-) Transcript_10749:1252-1497(-)
MMGIIVFKKGVNNARKSEGTMLPRHRHTCTEWAVSSFQGSLVSNNTISKVLSPATTPASVKAKQQQQLRTEASHVARRSCE